MGLLNKFFRQDTPPDSVAASGTRFQDSDSSPAEDDASRSAVRKELVQVTLRETMRRHAVPSDWLEVRMLPVLSRSGKKGMHVQLVVKQGQSNLLTYIPAFQSSLMAEIEKFEPRAWDWLLSISWQFAGITSSSGGELPGAAGSWTGAAAAGTVAAAAAEADAAQAQAEDDVAEDLQALFAIRDAALQQAPEAQPDFEPTRPGFSNSGPGTA